jgi:arylsulfatase A-like enzyme
VKTIRLLKCFAVVAGFLALNLGTVEITAGENPKPNIIFILCDDLGYGDVGCNNPAGKIATPNVDRLAVAGMRFTDAHTTSSVCSPTRYSIMTGRYNWRSRLQRGVLGGLSPPLIEPNRLTVAALLQQQGYHTAAIGKWHLGMDWVKIEGKPPPPADNVETTNQVWSVDFTKPIAGGPTSVGFHYYFGIAASLDMVPYTFIENDRVTVVPTLDKAFPMTLGRSGGLTRKGPTAPGFEVEQVLPTLTRKAVEYVAQRAADAKAGKPFFLYLPLNAPHTPIAPTAEWRGKSGLNPYADFVMQTDWTVGQVMDAVEKHGLADNTLLIFTSDNGCSPQANIPELREAGHAVNGPLRGHKADIWDGGHRVPFIVRWPGKVKAGATSDQLISSLDFLATCAEIVGVRLPANAAEDSISFLPALQGRTSPGREALVHHSIEGKFAIRQGKWKLCLNPGSGGWSLPKDPEALKQGLPEAQLYDMSAGVSETANLQAQQPEVVQRLTDLLAQYVSEGRSTPGAPQKNDTAVDFRKGKAKKGRK